MRTLKFTLIIILLSINFNCAELGAAMSNATANNCAIIEGDFYLYDSKNKEYKFKYIRDYDKNDNYIRDKESNWVLDKVYYYTKLPQFGIYYVTSPYSGADYKIATFCSSYYK